jgi:hypothetical protein
MSDLLDEIIRLAEDDKQSLPNLLRKCLRLASDLKNNELKTWANQELNGYDGASQVPPYRIVRAHAYGNFAGWFNSWYSNHLIVSAVMDEKHRKWAEEAHLVQSVAALDDLAKLDAAKGSFTSPWPSNLVALYQTRLMQDCVCHEAWQEIPKSVIVEILDTVRNKTLNMALEIREELGSSQNDLKHIKPEEQERIQNIVINNLGGNVALGDLDASGSTTIIAGDRRTLDEVLTKVGLNKEDLSELTEAILVDGGSKPGNKVTEWIQSKAGKVVAGGIKVGISVGQQLLTEWLKMHYGLK